MAYTDAATLKNYLGIVETEDDALLAAMIARAQAVIDAYCRQTFEAAADSTRYFDPTLDSDGTTLWLDAPICSITSITNGDGTTVTAAKYIKWPRNESPWLRLVLKANSGVVWTWTTTPENSISIVGKWAYSEIAPPDIEHVALRLASYLYRQKDNQGNDQDRSLAVAGGVILMPAVLPPDIKAMLRPYRRLL
jgi:hypothetical protein